MPYDSGVKTVTVIGCSLPGCTAVSTVTSPWDSVEGGIEVKDLSPYMPADIMGKLEWARERLVNPRAHTDWFCSWSHVAAYATTKSPSLELDE